MPHLEVVVQCDNIPVPLRYLLQHGDLISDLLWQGSVFKSRKGPSKVRIVSRHKDEAGWHRGKFGADVPCIPVPP